MVFACLALCLNSRAHAAATPPSAESSYVIQPESGQPASEIGRGYFTVTLKPGQTQSLRVAVKNLGTGALALYDYPADGMAMAAGGIGYSARQAGSKAVGTWLSINPGQMTLTPGVTGVVTATVHVPDGTVSGQYVGGVAFEDQRVQRQHSSGAIAIDVHYRQLIALVVTVPGRQDSSAKVGGVDLHQLGSGSEAVLTVQSTGNMLWKGTGTLQLGNGKQHTSTPFSIDTLLPGAQASVVVPMASIALLPGPYDVALHVTSSLGRALSWQGVVPLTSVESRNANSTPVATVVLQPHGQPTVVAPAVSQGGTTRRKQAPVGIFVAAGVLALLLLGAFALRMSSRGVPRLSLQLEFTQHARDQMALRGIGQAEVRRVLANRGVMYPDQYGNPCYVRRLGGRRIRVVVAAVSNPPRIITVSSQPRGH